MSSPLIGIGVNALVLVAMLLVPLWNVETLEVRQLEIHTRLVAPPPPAPPPPPAAAAKSPAPVRRSPIRQKPKVKMTLPTAIPKKVARVVRPPELAAADYSGAVGAPDSLAGGVTGGVPGGVPGGQVGGVIGGVLGGVPSVAPPPVVSHKPLPEEPLRVGGNIRPPQQLKYLTPNYPQVAKQAQLHGRVCIDAIIDTNGRVVEMKVLEGHPLLAKETMEAVRHWTYEPTRLNGQPVPIALVIKVNFSL